MKRSELKSLIKEVIEESKNSNYQLTDEDYKKIEKTLNYKIDKLGEKIAPDSTATTYLNDLKIDEKDAQYLSLYNKILKYCQSKLNDRRGKDTLDKRTFKTDVENLIDSLANKAKSKINKALLSGALDTDDLKETDIASVAIACLETSIGQVSYNKKEVKNINSMI